MVREGLSEKMTFKHRPEGVEEHDRHKKRQTSARPESMNRFLCAQEEMVLWIELWFSPNNNNKKIEVLGTCRLIINVISYIKTETSYSKMGP